MSVSPNKFLGFPRVRAKNGLRMISHQTIRYTLPPPNLQCIFMALRVLVGETIKIVFFNAVVLSLFHFLAEGGGEGVGGHIKLYINIFY